MTFDTNGQININTCTLRDITEAYKSNTRCTYHDTLSSKLSYKEMRVFLSALINERRKKGNFKSTMDFINRMYARLLPLTPYPDICLENFARYVPVVFPDGDSESLHYALIITGHDYRNDIIARFDHCKMRIDQAIAEQYEVSYDDYPEAFDDIIISNKNDAESF